MLHDSLVVSTDVGKCAHWSCCWDTDTECISWVPWNVPCELFCVCSDGKHCLQSVIPYETGLVVPFETCCEGA